MLKYLLSFLSIQIERQWNSLENRGAFRLNVC